MRKGKNRYKVAFADGSERFIRADRCQDSCFGDVPLLEFSIRDHESDRDVTVAVLHPDSGWRECWMADEAGHPVAAD